MEAHRVDLVDIVESLYRLDLSTDTWLELVSDKLRPLLDRDNQGIVGGLHQCPDPCSLAAERVVFRDVPARTHDMFVAGIGGLSPVFLADGLLSRSLYRGSNLRGWEDLPD